MTDKLSVSLVTPTYNECENVSLLAEEIFGLLASCDDIDLELIIVDDNSPDGTGAAAEALTDRYPVRVVHRAGKLGLGSAVMEGWKLSDRPYLGVIDADLSHDPEILPGLIRGLRQHDLTMGSRFGETSQVEKWALHRKLISVVGVGMARVITGAEDPLSGYFCLRREVIEQGFELTSKGYKILLEILVKGRYASHTSTPFVFRNRQFSDSKLNWREHTLFLKQILVFGVRRLLGRKPGS
ncbi:MAG: polyprenol monophosphomannose synthase [Candidatus Latescibacteria bacterium]|nr:polyprenol monophosphomannose synthase [Candidatus Latescibacterota bacterium]MDP7447705.1 polyprenol monophosphomannose synthase [Candidatus Latescibacterota bacterium]HJP33199.1 polyprenol monophosphomannose synthase [Candidatus Latescibacterota bacterium]